MKNNANLVSNTNDSYLDVSSSYISKLVSQAQAGEKEAFKQIYDIFYKPVFYYINSRISNYNDAEEITSDVFLTLLENINKFRGESSFKNYVWGIVKNKIKTYISEKKKNHGLLLSDLNLDYEMLPADDALQQNKEYKNRLRKALNYILKLMRPKYAQIINMRFIKMYTINEVARKLSISVNNVKVLQHRAIKKATEIWDNLNVETKAQLLQK